MKKQTMKDFEKEITRIETIYLEDKRKYGWNFTQSLENTGSSLQIFFIANQVVSTIIKFDEEFGFVETCNIGFNMLDKLKTMQASLTGESCQP